MVYMKKILFLLVIAVAFFGCEKDDICTEETTPRIVLEFYDISNPANLKNVVNLKVIGEGKENGIVFNETGTEITKYLANGNIIKLPLDPAFDVAKYHLILNSADTANDNEDILEFNYSRQELFVSRACGFKTVFNLNDIDGVLQSEPSAPDAPWIKNINIQNQTITSENETHIKVYF
jgi:hypothetical protein